MIIKYFYFALILSIMISCTTYNKYLHFDKNMQNISIGMTKENVIEILGNQYKSSGSELLDHDVLAQKLTYFDMEGLEYEFLFKNGKLSKWEKIRQNYKHVHKEEKK